MRVVLIGKELPSIRNHCQNRGFSYVEFESTLEFEEMTLDTCYTGTVKIFILNYSSSEIGRELTSDIVEYLRDVKNFDETILTTEAGFSSIPGVDGVISDHNFYQILEKHSH